MKEKLYSFLSKSIKEFNPVLLLTTVVVFLAMVGLLSYKMSSSYALFTYEIDGQKTIAIHYEKEGINSSQRVLSLLQQKASEINDGVYYFDDEGNLDYGNGTVVQLGLNSRIPEGIVSIWNKTPIYMCTKYGDDNYEYTQNTKQLKVRTLPCLTDRYQNLVINGDLSFKDNTNLTDFGTYNSEGYLSKTTSSRPGTYLSSDFIPVDPNKKYLISVDLKSSNTEARYYAGIAEFDVDKGLISGENISYIPNTLTQLSQDLNTGDKVIHFADLTNWNDDTSTRYYQRGFIFWNYKDSTGYEYPELTYSKNKYTSNNPALYEDGVVDKTNNTITLTSDSGWTGPAIPSGTKVSQSSSSGGGTYKYSVLSYSPITTQWQKYMSPVTTGYTINGSDSYSTYKNQTKFVRFMILDNYNGISDTTSYIKSISIKEVKE